MESIPSTLPVLPIRNAVLFPSISMPLVIGRERSVRAVEAGEQAGSHALVVTQRVVTQGDPEPTDLYPVGTLCKIENVTRTDSGSRQIVVTGLARFRITDVRLNAEGYLSAQGETLQDALSSDSSRREALFLNLKELSREILELLPGATDPLVRLIDSVDDPGYLSNVCAAYLNLPIHKKQELLEVLEVEPRMEILLSHMRKERESLLLQNEIRDKMSERLNKAQREALLREQMRTIRTELGENENQESDTLEVKLREAALPEEARKQAQEEVRRLRELPSSSAEYHVIRTYLEWLASLPWNKLDPAEIDLARAREVLDQEHSGLEAVKKRIIQYLAVCQLKSEATTPDNPLRGPILCLIGPPGVGKTSLGKSIARALQRKFVRASLGGVRDEAEIRGHRRTYVGALPGRIIQSLKRAGTRNPVLVLDEIDKLRADFQGDPSSALLEVLDPEQNHSFTDHYLDLPFDLSSVFFVATANVADTIPAPLRDRMEIIEMTGYTSAEKLEIAQRHLVPKLLRENGLKPEWIELPDQTIKTVIALYTREAGVRDLQRKLSSLFRAAAEEILNQRAARGTEALAQGPANAPLSRLEPKRLRALLGPEVFLPERLEAEAKPGLATGLAWTPHGGDILHVEATLMPHGKGALTLTGQLGEVMRESAQIALSIARSRTRLFSAPTDLGNMDVHIHVPAGSIPKDGPSAGVTMLAALASLFSGKAVRSGIAMTGEITLRGKILPVGGIKEKVLAAHRAGIRTVILPSRNEQDLDEVPQNVRSELRFVQVEGIEDLLAHVLSNKDSKSRSLTLLADKRA